MKNYSALILLLSLSVCTNAQEDKIQSDRPGESLTPRLTKKRFPQVEIGFEKSNKNKQDYTLTHPDLQIKYGLSNWIELRTELFAESNKEYSNKKFEFGLKPVEFGLKAKLLEQKGLLPATSFYSQIGIPALASKDHQTARAIPKLRLLFENQFAKKFDLNYNVGAEWDGEENVPKWLYSIDQEIELSMHWEIFIETFGYFQQGQAAQHHIDGGISFFPTNDWKLDVYAGKGLSKEASEYFISAGFSFRLK